MSLRRQQTEIFEVCDERGVNTVRLYNNLNSHLKCGVPNLAHLVQLPVGLFSLYLPDQ